MAVKQDILDIYAKEVEGIKEAGLFKGEAPIASPQGARVKLEDGREVINMCANNYLGLGDDKRLIEAAKKTYDEKGYGLASVRFICGTQDIHKQLEKRISSFLGMDDTILYSSCFDANGGLFETILTAARRERCTNPDTGRQAGACQHHRRRSSLQGKTLSLPQQRYG